MRAFELPLPSPPASQSPDTAREIRASSHVRRLAPLLRRPSTLAILALTAYVAVFFGWTLVGIDPDGSSDNLVNVAFIPIGLVATALAIWAARTPGLDGRCRSAWRRLAIALVCFWVGDLLWLVMAAIEGGDPYPSVADISYLAYYPAVLWGVLSFPAVLRSNGERLKFWLDALTVLVGGGMVVWYVLVGPTVASPGSDDPLATIVSIAYPVGDLVLLLAIAVTGLRRPHHVPRSALAFLFAALVVSVAADLWFGATQLAGDYTTGGPSDWGYMAFWLLSAWSAWSARVRYRAHEDVDERPRSSINALPYASVATGYGLLILATRDSWDVTTGGLVIGAVILTGIVLARQAAAVRENVRLLNDQATRQSEARFRSLVQNASDMIVVIDPELVVQYQTPSVERIMGHTRDALRGQRLAEIVHPDDVPVLLRLAADSIGTDGTTQSREIRMRRADGGDCVVELVITNLLGDPQVNGLVVTIRDIDDRKHLEDQLVHQAFHDSLTSLANRALFLDRVQHALDRATRLGGPAAVVFLDIDNFKTVNDSLGHAAGDAVLVEIARRLRRCTRTMDTVARFGGDEFAVLLEGGDRASGMELAERISAVLRPPVDVAGREVFVTVSSGIAVASGQENAEELLRDADVAMYMAKATGRAHHQVYEASMHATAVARLELEADLRHALERSEFRVRYQPIVELRDGHVEGAEALIRWHHPTRGVLLPSEFIRFAEESGQIVAMGSWVLAAACREAAAWKVPHGRPPFVSVNLSARQLDDAEFTGIVRETLRKTGLAADRLVLEITESLLMTADRIVRTLADVRSLGVRVAIDDFGTGYSSLSYLQKLPVDILKIDRSFVAMLDHGLAASPLARGIVELGRSLRLTTLAEGIETVAQATALRSFGCDMAQGFHFAPALEAPAFRDFLTELADAAPHAARLPAPVTT